MPDPETTPPSLIDLANLWTSMLASPEILSRLERVHTNAIAKGQTTAAGIITGAEIDALEAFQFLFEKADKFIAPIMAPILSFMVAHMLGIQVTGDQLREAATAGEGSTVGKTVANVLLDALTPPVAEITPSDEPAKKFMGMIATFILNSWTEGLLVSEGVGAIPRLHSLESFTELGQHLVNSLGFSRLMRVALRPLVDETIATPLRWKINNTYKPSRLAAGAIIRQLARQRMTRDEAFAELNREGWTDTRIEAMFNEAARFMSLSESMLLVRRGEWTEDQVVQDLQNQGYEQSVAQGIIKAYKENRIVNIEDDVLSAAKAAYAAQEIDEPQFRKLISIFVTDADELQAQLDVGGTLREMKRKRLTLAEVTAAVKAGILSFVDYRLFLEEESYRADDALTLELLLHYEMNAKADLVKARAEIVAARAKAAADRLAAKVAKQAEIDAARALHRQGSLTELRHAVIIGTIPESRYIQVLQGYYDPDTVQILVDVVEHDRQVYLDTQARAAAARQKAAVKNIDIRLREAAVLAGVLTLGEFADELRALTVDANDVQILVDTLTVKLADQKAAQQKKADAAAKAAAKGINLARFELLVRKGHRTMAEYDALLVELKFDEPARVAMEELLSIRIEEDQAAAATRAAAAAKKNAKGLTLAELHRAVVVGAATIADYEQFLIDQKFDVAAQQVLIATLQDDVASANAARSKRAATSTVASSPRLSVTQLARAARLGLISPDAYQSALLEAGYTTDDIAIEMDLLVQEIATVKAAQAKRDAATLKATDHGLTLGELHTAVLKGVATVQQYQARALELGYAADDVATLVGVLGEELAAQVDIAGRKTAVAAALKARGITLASLDQAVRAGQSTIDVYINNLESYGVDPTDADVLAGVLSGELTAAAPAA